MEKQSIHPSSVSETFSDPMLDTPRSLHMFHTPLSRISYLNKIVLGACGKWVSRIQEYDLEIRPTKLIKGQGLAKLLAEGNEKFLDINVVLEDLEKNEWYNDIIYYLKI
jgi:hypothetical protein